MGDVSVEGFTQVPANTSNVCAKITAPGAGTTGASGYKVYFSADAPLRWVSQHFYGTGATILDSNGNIQYTSLGGTSGCYPGPPPSCGSDPSWNTAAGVTTNDGSITWTNEGPVVPGSGSGGEVYQAGTTVCGSAGVDPAPGVGCEIDTIQTGSVPKSVTVFNGGAITGVNTSTNTATFTNLLPVGLTLQGNKYAWGHDDTSAISNAVLAMKGLASGGTLFFPVSSGCYAITQLISTPVTGGSFLALTGEGSASSQMLGGPGTIEQRPAASCVAAISSGAQAGFTFPVSGSATNAAPIVERLGFVDPFGNTQTALTFFTSASTRVRDNSFQGFAKGTAILFDAQETVAPPPYSYNQFVQVQDNVCLSVQNCIVMKNGATNPAWIERNRCVSAQMGGGRCVQLGPNLLGQPQYSTPYNAGATNWIVENFALYFPISFESIDEYADYWIGNSNQQTASLQMQPNMNIIGGGGSGTALHIGGSATGIQLCHDNEIVGGNSTSNAVGLFVDPQCSATLHIGYTALNNSLNFADFGLQTNFWNPELGTSISAPTGVNPLTVANQNGNTAFQVTANGNLKFLGNSSTGVTTIDSAATAAYNFVLPSSAGTSGQPLLSGGGAAMTFGPLSLGSSTVSVNSQSGTSYTVASTDQGKLVTFSNTSSVAVTLPQATGNFGAGWWVVFENRNSGVVNITPTTSTIDGATKYSLQQNQGVVVVSDGTNYFTARGNSAGIANAGIGGMFVPAGTPMMQGALSAQTVGSTSANQVHVFQFVLPTAVTVGHLVVNIATASSGKNAVFGIYDAAGNKLLESGAVLCSAVAVKNNPISPAVNLPAGVYYYAFSTDETTATCQVSGLSQASVNGSLMNANGSRYGTAATSTSGNVMPATLGTITPVSGSESIPIAYVEP